MGEGESSRERLKFRQLEIYIVVKFKPGVCRAFLRLTNV